jgi:iron complex outermembrane recepter protein
MIPSAHRYATVLTAAWTLCAGAGAQQPGDEGASKLDIVQVTATRFSEPVQEVPSAISVITGDELHARGANDLRTALALLGGVNVAPGGDGGPAGSVPGLLGLREVDDFLLVVDGVPAGGAFIPHFETLDLHNVERIEVVRGTAPVYYGTTAFAGTINVVHFAAGKAQDEASVSAGSFGSAAVEGSAVLSRGPLRQSLAADVTHQRFLDSRSGFDRYHGLYRAAGALDGGSLRFDLDIAVQRQKPGSPTPVDDSGQLTTRLPSDFNQSPADARIDTDRTRAVLAYENDLGQRRWSTTLALTHTHAEVIQGFLLDGYADAVGDNAAGFSQARSLNDWFLDTSITQALWRDVSVTCGLNELYGHARQDSGSFTYTLPLDGTAAPASGRQPLESATGLADTRSFFGLYSQARWKLTRDLSVLAGLRWNHVRESQQAGDGSGQLYQSQVATRLSGSLGANWRIWQDAQGDLDDVALYVNTGNTFQPPQIDFGPDAGFSRLLRPETERSVEAGIKADGFDGRLDVDLTAFWVDFDHQALTTQVNGLPALVNGGQERFKGVELEGSWRPGDEFRLAASISLNDARYRQFETLIGSSLVQLKGNRLILSPQVLAGAGASYAPREGWRASATVNYVGPRYLDRQNTERVGGYFTVDASVGYGFAGFSLSLNGYNVGDRRDPVQASELGDGQFYRLPGRTLMLMASLPLRGSH